MASEPVAFKTILESLGGTLQGTAPEKVKGFCSLDEPLEDHIAFLTSNSLSRLPEGLKTTRLAALIVPVEIEQNISEELSYPLILVEHPLKAVSRTLPLFFPPHSRPQGISELASVHPEARIAQDASVGPFCVVEKGAVVESGVILHPHVVLYPECSIGKNTTIHSHAVVRERCRIGAGSVIQNGAIIGADGFGYFPDPELGLERVPQVGIVHLQDRVDVGANACIDRATLGTTSIGLSTKIDNLVQIGHNAAIGMYSILCALTGVGGSTKIGNQVTIGGSSGVADHVQIVDGSRFGGKSGVTGSILDKGDYMGFPAVPATKWKRQRAAVSVLPELIRDIRSLIKKNKNT